MLPDPLCLLALAAVAHHDHYGRAAASLHITTSALSKRVLRLERQVGAPLVVRGPGGTAGLTPRGEAVALEGRTVLDALSRTQVPRPVGAVCLVRLGIPGRPQDHVSAATFRIIAAALRAHDPQARLAVLGVPYGADDAWLAAARVDVMLGMVPPRGRNIAERPLAALGRRVMVPAGDALTERSSVTAADLAARRLLTEQSAGPRWMAPWLLADITSRPCRDVAEVRVRGARDLVLLVAAGAGIGIVKESLIPIPGDRVALLPLAEAPLLLLRASYRRDDRRAAVQALLTVLVVLASTLTA